MRREVKRFLTPEERVLKKIFRWVRKGGFAILDQGLFALSNFLVNIFLARWLTQNDYGAFAVAYSIFNLFGAFHATMLTEPMLIYGAGKYAADFRKYLGSLLLGHLGVALLISVILAGAGAVLWLRGTVPLSQAIFGLAIASPFILILLLLRRAFYVGLKPHLSATGGALYMLLMAGGAYGLFRRHWLSTFSGFLVMGVSSLLVSIWLLILLKPHWKHEHKKAAADHHKSVLADHWDYGKWATASVFFRWFPFNIYYTLLPVFAGLEGSATLRALMNLIAPISNSNAALGGLMVPKFVTTFHARGKKGLNRLLVTSLAVLMLGAVIYWLFLVLFGPEVVRWLYHGKYKAPTLFFLLMGALPLLGGIGLVIGAAMRALKLFDKGFYGSVIASAVTLTLGLWFLKCYGATGAVLGLLSSGLAGTAAGIYFYTAQKQHGTGQAKIPAG